MTYSPRPRLQPPDYIRLPDGRQIALADLVNRTTNKQNHNLRTGRVRRREPQSKYSAEDLAWIRTAAIADIQQRFGITEAWAMALRSRARHDKTYQEIQRSAQAHDKDSS